MGTVNSVVDIINGITRIAMALVPLGIVLGVLFGANADLFNNVIINLINIIKLFKLKKQNNDLSTLCIPKKVRCSRFDSPLIPI